MAIAAESGQVAWWKEPTREQWHAWIAAWLGWTLDAFDFTIFMLIMLPISQSFNVPLVDVTAVLALTLWMRLVGATASGWLADRMGRKKPLMISIAWYSVANLLAGLAPTFWLLFLFRALMGIGMGAEWPVGAALAMEQWPIRSRGFMSGVLQGSWGLGALLSSLAYGLLYNYIGWRGLLIIGVLPALAILYVRRYVKEPEVWLENRRRQRAENREVKVPLFSIFKPAMLGNTLTACWWMASNFIVAYSMTAMFATWLQKDLQLSPALVALPVMLLSIGQFGSGVVWGWVANRIGRRWAIILPAVIGLPLVPLYLFTQNYTMIVVFFGVQGWFAGGGIWSQAPAYLSERFPTEARDGVRVLLSPGGDLGRLRPAGRHVLRDQLAIWICDPDADWHGGRFRQPTAGTVHQSGNPWQGVGGRRGPGLSRAAGGNR
jgi:SHS family lactate transporter-like MFS transporter